MVDRQANANLCEDDESALHEGAMWIATILCRPVFAYLRVISPQENLDLFDWNLSAEETAQLDGHQVQIPYNPADVCCTTGNYTLRHYTHMSPDKQLLAPSTTKVSPTLALTPLVTSRATNRMLGRQQLI